MALAGYGSSGTDTLTRAISGWPSQGPRPWFYSCWMNWGTYASPSGAFEFTNTAQVGVNNAPRIGLRNLGSATGWLFTDSGDTSNAANITPTYTATTGSWFHHAANLTGSFGREIFFDGVSKGSNTTASPNTQTLQVLQVGYAIGGALPTGSSIAEIVFGTGTLTSGQIASLAAGAHPLAVLSSSQIICYLPLKTDAVDISPNSPVNLVSGGSISAAAIAPGSSKWVAHPTIDAAPSGGGGSVRKTLVSIIT